MEPSDERSDASDRSTDTSSSLGLISEHEDRDALSSISAVLELADLARLSTVNQFFATSVKADRGLWDSICAKTFHGKACVASEAKRLRTDGDPRSALRVALADSRRATLTEEEICSFEWNFRFKEAAGPGWCEEDPYWQGAEGGPAKIKFGPLTERGYPASEQTGQVSASGFEMLTQRRLLWSWARSRGPHGGHVQIRVDGMRVPTYVVSRHAPNWGWLMQSCWVLYTSFPMPARGTDADLEDDALDVTVTTQAHEAQAYNTGVTFDAPNASDDEGDDPPAGGGPTAVVQLANGESIVVPVWLLHHLGLQEHDTLSGAESSEADDDDDDDDDNEAENDDEDDGDGEMEDEIPLTSLS